MTEDEKVSPQAEAAEEEMPSEKTPPIEDVADEFLAAATEPDRTAFTSTADIIAAAHGWCEAHGEFRFGRRILAKQLQRAGYRAQRTSKQRGWRGVKLR